MSGVRDCELAAIAAARALIRRRRAPGAAPCVTISGESWAALQYALANLDTALAAEAPELAACTCRAREVEDAADRFHADACPARSLPGVNP